MNILVKRFLKIALASIAAETVAYLLVFIDNVVAGQMIGENAVAAITVMAPVVSFNTFVAYIMTVGYGMMISYALGNGDRDEADRLYSQGLITCIAAGILLSLGLFLFKDRILYFFELSDEIRILSELYFYAVIFAPVPLFLNTWLYVVLPIDGLEDITVKASALECVTNIILNIILCKMFGMIGISISTVIGHIAGTALMIMTMKRRGLQFRFGWFYDIKKFLESVSYSFLTSVDTISTALLPFFMTAIIVSGFGEKYLTIFALELNIVSLVVTVFIGLADSIQTILCQLYAEKSFRDIQSLSKMVFLVTIAMSITSSIVMYVFAPFIPGLFGIQEPELIAEGVRSIHTLIPTIPFFSLTLIICNYYIFTEKKIYGAAMQFLVICGAPVAFAWLFSGNYGINGIWTGMSLGFTVVLFLSLIITKIYAVSRKGKYTAVLLLEKDRLSRQKSYHIRNNTEEIMKASGDVADYLDRFGIPERKKAIASLVIEETGMRTVDHDGEGRLMLEYIVTAENDGRVTIVSRDDGESRDLISDSAPLSIREYMITRISKLAQRKTYIPNGDENRLIFTF